MLANIAIPLFTANITLTLCEFAKLNWGTAWYKSTGKDIPEDGFDVLRKFNASVFGAVGAPGMNYKPTPKMSTYPDMYCVLFEIGFMTARSPIPGHETGKCDRKKHSENCTIKI